MAGRRRAHWVVRPLFFWRRVWTHRRVCWPARGRFATLTHPQRRMTGRDCITFGTGITIRTPRSSSAKIRLAGQVGRRMRMLMWVAIRFSSRIRLVSPNSCPLRVGREAGASCTGRRAIRCTGRYASRYRAVRADKRRCLNSSIIQTLINPALTQAMMSGLETASANQAR